MNMILHGVHYRKFDIKQEDTFKMPNIEFNYSPILCKKASLSTKQQKGFTRTTGSHNLIEEMEKTGQRL